MSENELMERIAINPGVMVGKPVIVNVVDAD
jgi:uncharacterized protein (DUF433 family)